MIDLDPLIAHLHLRSAGSWTTFTRAVESFDTRLDGLQCARSLAEHALVEFDFDGDRKWSVTTVGLVADAWDVVSAWGGTPRGLRDEPLLFQETRRRATIGTSVASYSHAVQVRPSGRFWPRHLRPIPAETLRGPIPSIEALLSRCATIDFENRSAKADERTDRLMFRIERQSDPSNGSRYRLIRGAWEPAPRIVIAANALWRTPRDGYVLTRNHIARSVRLDIGLWSHLSTWSEREGSDLLVSYEDDRLTLTSYPRVPTAYARMLVLAGAQEGPIPRFGVRTFTGVDRSTAEWLCDRLAIKLE